MTRSILLCHRDELPEGSSRGFDPHRQGRDTVFVVRKDGLHGYRNACPHWADTPMAWRKDAYLSGDGLHIACHAHGARFDIASGVCVLGPCMGQVLTHIPLIQNDDGEIRLITPHSTETHT